MAAAFGLESTMKVNRHMWRDLKDAMILRTVLTLLMVSFLRACKGEVFNANITLVKSLDPNITMIQLQKLVSLIQATEQYYPGLVVSTTWQDPVKNLTVLGRVLLYTPNCSMEARDGEYTASGMSISNYTAEMLNGSCGRTIAQAPSWVTCVQENMWLDYFSKPEIEIQSKVSEVPVSLDTYDNNTLVSNFSKNDCIPHLPGTLSKVDSIISSANGESNILHARDVVMSSDRTHMVEMQSDCNLVVYTYPARVALWASNTFLSGTNCTAAMQVDGNMVVYNGDGSPLWSSKSYTQDYVGTFRFTIQTDGLAVVYNMESGQILWAGYRPGL
ncbi:hypothetical protein Mapa_012083 [Marchantia paleacea]|nr:hypothetical protein Mapa_012083 [Marchantia paleacea]